VEDFPAEEDFPDRFKMEIRKAILEDVKDIVSLGIEFMKENNNLKTKEVSKADKSNKESNNLFRKFVKENIKSKNGLVLVAEYNSKIIGFMQVHIQDNIKGYKVKKIGHIDDLFVKKKFRKNKVSTLLKDTAIHWFKSKNLKYITLQTEMRNNNAHKIYIKWGFFEHHLTMFKKL